MGMWMGLRFRQETWLGGYGALLRRMVRLAHVALAALGIINIEFGQSTRELILSSGLIRSASFAFIVTGASMPTCCLFIAKGSRRFEIFVLPIGSLVVALLLTMGGLLR